MDELLIMNVIQKNTAEDNSQKLTEIFSHNK